MCVEFLFYISLSLSLSLCVWSVKYTWAGKSDFYIKNKILSSLDILQIFHGFEKIVPSFNYFERELLSIFLLWHRKVEKFLPSNDIRRMLVNETELTGDFSLFNFLIIWNIKFIVMQKRGIFFDYYYRYLRISGVWQKGNI